MLTLFLVIAFLLIAFNGEKFSYRMYNKLSPNKKLHHVFHDLYQKDWDAPKTLFTAFAIFYSLIVIVTTFVYGKTNVVNENKCYSYSETLIEGTLIDEKTGITYVMDGSLLYSKQKGSDFFSLDGYDEKRVRKINGVSKMYLVRYVSKAGKWFFPIPIVGKVILEVVD